MTTRTVKWLSGFAGNEEMAASIGAVGDRGLHSGGSGIRSRARGIGKKRYHLRLLTAAASVLAAIVILFSLSASSPLAPQQNLRAYTVTEPPPLLAHDMAYDAQSDRIILFGGTVKEVGYRDETYSYDFDTNTWTNMAPTTAPSERFHHSMTYDSQSDRVILCGGVWEDGGTLYSKYDTWAYDFEANSWTEMSPYEELGGYCAGFTYDSHSDRVVRFGGSDQWVSCNYTYTYDLEADDWSNMNPASPPDLAFSPPAMVYDSESDVAVMFGLILYQGIWGAMTWAYDLDQNTWTYMHSVQHPPKMYHHAMAYDSQSDRVILFGGYNDINGNFDQTWAYDFNTNMWAYMNPPTHPSARSYHAMAYDSQSDRVILYGGYVSDTGNNETWAYDFEMNTWTLLPPGQIIPEFGATGVVVVIIATVCIFVAIRRTSFPSTKE